MRRVYHSFCALALLSSLLLASPAQAGGLSRQKKHAKRSNRYNSNWSYSLYRASRPSYSGYSGASTSSSSRRNLELVPDTVDKRTIYTGRYCAYPVKKLVPQRFTNGTQTYRKRVVSHCPWNDLYCNPTISYVIARRRLYATRMAVVTRDEWRCCPGFSGDTCSNVCFNCSIVEALKEKVEQLSQQTTGPATSQGAVGPPGQPGPRGAAGPAGPPGPDGLTGQPGLVGPKGQKGSRGMMGLHGFAGLKGDRGEAGSPGATGAPGTSGLKGEKGEEGDIGPTGLDGAKGEPGVNGTDGLNGLKGERGDIGPAGPTGPPGNGNSSAPGVKGDRGLPGIQGAAGPPGPPGVCGCPDSTATPSESTPVVSPGSNACIHEGQIYANNHLWKSDTCTECVCLDGDVHCFSIECPMTTSCQHKYVPEGYCCQVCCPADEDASSGEGSGEDDDGSEETSSSSSSSSVSSHQERSAERPPEDYPAYEYDYDGVEDRTRRSVEKSSQCPLSGVNSRMTPQGTDSRCILPVDSGPCRGRFAKFHYNEASGTCQRFVYGGCEGNANNFETPELCKRTCIDGAPPIGVSPPSEIAFGDPPQRRCLDAVQFDTCNHTFPEYYFDYRVDVCFRAPRGLCSVTRNRFHTPGECESVCQGPYMIFGVSTPENIDAPRLDLPKICTFPRKDGSCRGRFPRFYFSVKENRCKLFTYSGCSGNANRFLTPWACRDACGGKEPSFLHSDSDTLPERCYKPRIKGICKASIPMFYYNPITDKCNVFVYGGCGGNDNRFEEASQCTKVCGGEPSLEFEPYKPDPPTISSRNASPKGTDIENLPAADGALPVACAEPLRAGPCRASLYRYFFDAATRRCSVFVYGGCRGNGNNFETPEECQDVCGAHGFNYSVTLESDLNQQDVQPRGFTGELASPASGVAGPAGPKGEKGDAGPMGPQGISGVGTTGEPGPKGSKGEATRSSSSAPLDRDQMSEVRKTIELLRSRIAFLERQFLNNLDPTGGGDGNIEEILLPNLVRPDKADDDLSGFDSDSPDSSSFNDDLLRSNAAPRGRGDNAEPSGPRPRSAIRHRGRPILVSDSSFEMRSEE